jgi:hypothetical protein
MTELVAAVGAYIVFGTLLFSGGSHARHPVRFRTLLRRQDLWPPRTEPAVVGAVITAELGIGITGAVAFVSTGPLGLVAAGLAGSAALYLLFAGYAALLVRRGIDVPCACSGGDAPANVWTVVRAGLLAFTSVTAWIAVERVGIVLTPAPSARAVLVAIAGAGLGITIWTLPSALRRPDAAGPDRRGLAEGT